jgi:hypothetical protein
MSAACPRCDYDLSGHIATWSTSCPLQGTCSECGLTFSWRDVLNPRFTLPRWSFEHAPRPAARWYFATLVHAALPWSFWSGIKLQHQCRRDRLYRFGLRTLVVTHILFTFAYLAVAAAQHNFVGPVVTWLAGYYPAWVQAIAMAIWPYGPYPDDSGFEPPLDFWFVWSLLWTLFVPLAFANLLPWTLSRCQVHRRHFLRALVYSLPAVPMIALVPIAARIYYFATFRTVLMGPPPLAVRIAYDIASSPFLFVVGTAIWLSIYWWCVVTRYLLLPHPRLLTLVLLFLTFLASGTVVIYLPGSRLHHELGALLFAR